MTVQRTGRFLAQISHEYSLGFRFSQSGSAMNERTIFFNSHEITALKERAAYLDKACAGDAALRARIDALLRAHEAESGPLDALAGTPAAPKSSQGILQCHFCEHGK